MPCAPTTKVDQEVLVTDYAPTPHTVNFNHKKGQYHLGGEKRNMEVNWDATDSSVMSSETDGLDFNVEDDQPLDLHAVSTCAELSDTTMDKFDHDTQLAKTCHDNHQI